MKSVSICLGFLLSLAGLLLFSPPTGAKDGGGNPFKHLVDIGGGRHLNMVCAGKGLPTIVFMQGLGGNFADWRKVREPVTALTRTCFYDRAGLGYSDPSDKPSSAANVADDLHALLRAAGIKDRVVLVGASLGGLFATYYADKFGADVAGLVLVDPSFSGQFDYAVNAGDGKILDDTSKDFAVTMRSCGKLAGEGKLSKTDSHDYFFPLQSNLTPDYAEYVLQSTLRAPYYAGLASETKNLEARKENDRYVDGVDGDQERRIARTFGSLPLIVLTSGKALRTMTISEAGKAAAQGVWERGHDRLAQRSTRGESIHLPDTGHRIDLEKPERIVESILKVVAQVREQGRFR